MKTAATLLGLTLAGLALAACASGTGEPSVLADGAVTGLWSSREPADVEACIGRLVGPEASSRYKVMAADRQKTAFVTTVSVMSPTTDTAMDQAITRQCLMPTN